MTVHSAVRGGEGSTAAPKDDQTQPGRAGESMSNLAYDRIEDMIVHARVAPGASITMRELQEAVNLGRTPVHQAVRRLAAETLIQIRPRDGLMVSPIDLERDRRLLELRRDMDRFVIRQASRFATANIRNQLLRITQQLQSGRETMSLFEFNVCDRMLDRALMDAAGEPFLERTLRPLHTVFRRIGGLYLTHITGPAGLRDTIDHHLDLLQAFLHKGMPDAIAASDRLIAYADSMFDDLVVRIDPTLLDARQADYRSGR
jgi:DNA-binding GntR family transcriptional regulator